MFLIYIYKFVSSKLWTEISGFGEAPSLPSAHPRGWSYDRSRKGHAQISSISSGKHHGKPHEKFNGLVLLGKSEHRKPELFSH